MADIFSKDWFKGVGAWGTQTAQKLIENVLFGKKTTTPGGSGGDPTSPGGSDLKQYLPYALIAAALVGALFLFRKK